MVKVHHKRKDKNKTNFKKFTSASRSKAASTNPDRLPPSTKPGAQHHFRTKNTIKRLKLYNEKPDLKQMQKRPTDSARIEPDRKWFGNIRTVDQKALEKFRVEMAQHQDKPRSVLVRAKKLPLNLLNDPTAKQFKLLQVQTYEQTFGPNSHRKRCKVGCSSLEEMAQEADRRLEERMVEEPLHQEDKDAPMDIHMRAGMSKRIWDQLYKVIDSSDVLCHVLDARDPQGTRSRVTQQYLSKHQPHKHLVFILNKIDLVPIWVTAKWVQELNKVRPTVAFKSSTTNPYGKGSLISLLKQFDHFHRDKKELSVGFIGYPNVGKSSVINTLKEKACCKAAPVPGETKVWQYVALTSRINLIDCPGTVHVAEGNSDIEQVLRGCVRAQRIKDPMFFIPDILQKSNPEQLKALYKIDDWIDDEDFILKVGRARGKLVKGGEVDQVATCKIVLMDWVRGKIMYYNLPEGVAPNSEFYKEKEQMEEEESQQLNEAAFEGQRQLLMLEKGAGE